ncbi:photosystem II 5 kDa protein, chloroplastic [Mercurialis annua]|uniref:photosystem II 5 kDa protein, chloroplastic n=1 Tax=Mercurialis annua TaxID=3986 RepID=UPI00215DD7C7|nr:photosystem II 5 kDa protein, chloroplastic [Mercurialis annua]
MASMTMTASLLAGSTVTRPFTAPRRGLIMAKASNATQGGRANVEMKNKEESSGGRRDLVFAAAAAAAWSVARVAMADEPKAGTEEARKKYAPICVTMPTARVCRN